MDIYCDYDVSRLVLLTRERDDSAFAELVRRYTPMMNKVISGFIDTDLCYGDLFAEATVAIHVAALRYDLDQEEVTFGLFSRVCVHHRLVDYLRREEKSVEIVDLDIETLSDSDELERCIVTRDTVAGLLSGAEKILSDYEYKVLIYHIQGYKTAAIAKALGRAPKSVDNAKSRIFRRLRSEYGKVWEN